MPPLFFSRGFWQHFAIAISIYSILLFVGFLPGVLRFFDGPGLWTEGSALYYRLWWYWHALLSPDESIWRLSQVLPPEGIHLLRTSNGIGKELIFTFLGAPANPQLYGNLFVVTAPLTVALTGFTICYRLFRRAFYPALLAGWFCGWNGFAVEHIVHPWLSSLEGLLIFLAILLLLRQRVSRRRIIFGSIAAAITVWFSLQSLVYLPLVSLIFIIDRLIHRDLRSIGALAIIACFCAIASSPLLWQTWVSYQGDLDSMSGDQQEIAMMTWRVRGSELILHPRSHLSGGVVENLGESYPFRGSHEAYLGLIVLALAALGVWTRRRGAGFLLALTVTSILLSMGPVLTFWNQEEGLPGPFALFMEIPPFATLRTPARFMTVAHLALALLAGFGGLRLFRKRWTPPALRPVLAGALLILTLIDRNDWPIPWFHNNISPFYQEIARQEGDFYVLDLPYQRGMQNFMHYGAYHQKGVIWGFGGRVPAARIEKLEAAFRFPLIATTWPKSWPTDYARFAKALREYNVRYLIVHRRHLELSEQSRDLMNQALTVIDDPTTWANQEFVKPPRRVHEGDIVIVYEIQPATGLFNRTSSEIPSAADE